MSNKFEQIDEDRFIHIVNIGFQQFAHMGEKNISLNTIIRKAEISKGFFYHYFKNKEEFYNYLTNYAIDIVIEKFKKEEILSETDYLERLKLSAIYKIELLEVYPALFDFLTSYYRTMTPEEYMELIKKKGNNFVNNFLYENIDYSLFKEEVPPQLVVKMVGRYNNQILLEIDSRTDLKSFKDKIDFYTCEIDEIKKIFYKKGE